jgi:DNA modification methylase
MKLEGVIYCGDNLYWMSRLPDEFVDLCYIDPPFFSNKTYEVIFKDGEEIRSFEDRWKGGIENYIDWMRARVEQIHRLLKPTGSFYLHCDWHAGHYLKVMCDEIFGRGNFRNEIVWFYSVGGKGKRYWARKHDTILFFTKSNKWTFNAEDVKEYAERKTGKKSFGGRIGRDEKGRLYQDKVTKGGKVYRYYLEEGKIPEDVWEIQSIQSQSKERLGYPTQKPERLLERIIQASSNPYDLVFDCFCACGTTLVAAQKLGRRWLGIDVSPTGCKLVQYRLSKLGVRPEIIGLPRTIEELKQLSPIEFQNWVIGAAGGRVSDKKSRDMGIDGYTFYGLYGEREYPIAVKRMDKVGRIWVDNFETAMRRKQYTKGYIVAFDFTRDAYEEVARAKSQEGLDIELVKVDEIKKRFLEGFMETLKGIGLME